MTNTGHGKKGLKVLAIAYACSPYQGSEAGVGWGWVNMIASEHRVTCITASRNKDDIKQYHAEHGNTHEIVFHYIDHVWNQTFNRIWPPYYLWTYKKWQDAGYQLSKELYSLKRFDLCHLITYVGFRVPGQFYNLDCPFVWGPIGGLENTT